MYKTGTSSVFIYAETITPKSVIIWPKGSHHLHHYYKRLYRDISPLHTYL